MKNLAIMLAAAFALVSCHTHTDRYYYETQHPQHHPAPPAPKHKVKKHHPKKAHKKRRVPKKHKTPPPPAPHNPVPVGPHHH